MASSKVMSRAWGKQPWGSVSIPCMCHVFRCQVADLVSIGMDLNPYKFEAPWHAFEFGFHILEVQAHLVIITMAWLTREDQRHFTQTPAEPDMETLTYWIQRLEPVIRAEDNEEVIVVFCNRTGIEDDAVYAGTSAVIGVKEGEVLVYGLLGRGVKEVLVVDTDDPPFAKLVARPEGETADADSRISEAMSDGSGRNDVSSKEAEPTARPVQAQPQIPPENKPSGRTRKNRPPTKIEIPEQRRRSTSFTSLDTPVAESPGIPTPTCPSPTPLSARPKLRIPGMGPADNHHIDTPYSRKYPVSENSHPLKGSIPATNESQLTAGSGLQQPSEKFFWLPSQTLLGSPTDLSWPATPGCPAIPALPAYIAPPESPTVATSLIRISRSDNRSRPKTPKTKRSFSPRSEPNSSQSTRSRPSRKARPTEKIAPARPATTNGSAPMRPYSPKPRNASRSGRLVDRQVSEAAQPDMTAMIQRLQDLQMRPHSAMSNSAGQPGDSSRERPRSPKSRNASRSGRTPYAEQAFQDRAVNLSRGSIPIGASESALDGPEHRPQPDIFSKFRRRLNEKITELEEARSVSSSYRRQDSKLATDGIDPVDIITAAARDIPTAHIEPEDSRTMLWSEVSKIIGEVLHRPDSDEGPRGRRRNHSAHSPPAQQQIWTPPSRGAQSGSRPDQSRNGQINGQPVRTLRYPSQGPQADPDDEIVAEIIFHHRDQPQRNNSSQGGDNTSQTNTAALQNRASPRSGQNSDRRQRQKGSPALAPQKASKTSTPETVGAKHKTAHTIKPVITDVKLGAKNNASAESLLPTLSGSSIHTMNSSRTSPATPPSRSFEPTTPKAMTLDLDSYLLSIPDPTASLHTEPLTSMLRDAQDVRVVRPRSALW